MTNTTDKRDSGILRTNETSFKPVVPEELTRQFMDLFPAGAKMVREKWEISNQGVDSRWIKMKGEETVMSGTLYNSENNTCVIHYTNRGGDRRYVKVFGNSAEVFLEDIGGGRKALQVKQRGSDRMPVIRRYALISET